MVHGAGNLKRGGGRGVRLRKYATTNIAKQMFAFLSRETLKRMQSANGLLERGLLLRHKTIYLEALVQQSSYLGVKGVSQDTHITLLFYSAAACN